MLIHFNIVLVDFIEAKSLSKLFSLYELRPDSVFQKEDESVIIRSTNSENTMRLKDCLS